MPLHSVTRNGVQGDVIAGVREENDFIITQTLITQSYAEINLEAGVMITADGR